MPLSLFSKSKYPAFNDLLDQEITKEISKDDFPTVHWKYGSENIAKWLVKYINLDTFSLFSFLMMKDKIEKEIVDVCEALVLDKKMHYFEAVQSLIAELEKADKNGKVAKYFPLTTLLERSGNAILMDLLKQGKVKKQKNRVIFPNYNKEVYDAMTNLRFQISKQINEYGVDNTVKWLVEFFQKNKMSSPDNMGDMLSGIKDVALLEEVFIKLSCFVLKNNISHPSFQDVFYAFDARCRLYNDWLKTSEGKAISEAVEKIGSSKKVAISMKKEWIPEIKAEKSVPTSSVSTPQISQPQKTPSLTKTVNTESLPKKWDAEKDPYLKLGQQNKDKTAPSQRRHFEIPEATYPFLFRQLDMSTPKEPAQEQSMYPDYVGHGTAVSSTIVQGAAPSASAPLIGLKTMDDLAVQRLREEESRAPSAPSAGPKTMDDLAMERLKEEESHAPSAPSIGLKTMDEFAVERLREEESRIPSAPSMGPKTMDDLEALRQEEQRLALEELSICHDPLPETEETTKTPTFA